MSILVAVIYAAFISLGLPDAVVGAAWPSMAPDLGADKAGAGLLSFIIMVATILVSFASGYLLRRFGTFKVCSVSVALTALALVGYGFAPNFWWLCILSVPLGLGGGAIDAALNSYAALHFSTRSMNLLHASWGIGATAGPLIVGFFLNSQGEWRPAYFVIAGLQFFLFSILLLSRNLWPEEVYETVEESDDVADAEYGPRPDGSVSGDPSSGGSILSEPGSHESNAGISSSNKPISSNSSPSNSSSNPGFKYQSALTPWYKMQGIVPTLFGFFCYSSLELSTGLWAATFLSIHHGLTPDVTAAGASAFYIGLTVGRVIAAFLAKWVRNSQLLIWGTIILALGAVIALVFGSPWGAISGFATIGLGCAPIYPATIKETTRRFGPANTSRLMGIQMGLAYTGMLIFPPLLGILITRVSPIFMPATIFVLGLGLLFSVVYMERMIQERERAFA